MTTRRGRVFVFLDALAISQYPAVVLALVAHPSLFTLLACVSLLVISRFGRNWLVMREIKSSSSSSAAAAAQMKTTTTELPRMEFVLLAMGTRGDVQPVIALAACLNRRGHHSTVVAASQFQSLVRLYNIDFKSCGIDSFESQEAGWMTSKTPAEFMATVAGSFMNLYSQVGVALFEAAQGKDCIITGHSGIHLALDVSDKTGVAVWALHLMPEGYSWYRAPFGERDNWLGVINKWRHFKRLLNAVRAAHLHKVCVVWVFFLTLSLSSCSTHVSLCVFECSLLFGKTLFDGKS